MPDTSKFKRKGPKVIIDKSLNKYEEVVLFPEKLARANEMLSKSGHPQDYLDKLDKKD